MEPRQVGETLVKLCKSGKNMDAINSLYSPEVVSIEAQGTPQMPAEMRGIDKIREKNQWWYENHEVHSASVEGPYPHNDRFAVRFKYDVTPKNGPMQGKRIQMDEIGLYTVRDGKIVREEFFYDM